MFPVYRSGFDFGNSDTCFVAIDQTNMTSSIVVPSLTAFGNLQGLAQRRSGMGDNYERDVDALASDETVLSFKGSEYFIGTLAETQSRDAETGRGDVGRYASPRALHMLLASSAKLIQRPEYELHVVTGLPIESYTKENRSQVKDILEGDHAFEINGRPYRARVRVSKVIMEGAGALIAYGDPKSSLQGAIDIGGRTTDLYAARGQKAEIELCKGKAKGVETVGDRLSAKMQTHFKRPLRAGEVKACLRAYLGQGEYPSVNAMGKTVEAALLQDWTEHMIQEVANEVVGFVAQAWNSSEAGDVASDINPVVLVGGGAYYFHRVIIKRIPHAVMPLQPERANAKGYAALASVLQSQNRMSA